MQELDVEDIDYRRRAKALTGLTDCEKLNVDVTEVTDAGVKDLQKALPKLEIDDGPCRSSSRLHRPPLRSHPATSFVHFWGGPVPNEQIVTPPLQFPGEIMVFLGAGRIAGGDAAVVIGGTVLADVLVGRAVVAVLSAGSSGNRAKGSFCPVRSFRKMTVTWLIGASEKPTVKLSAEAGECSRRMP